MVFLSDGFLSFQLNLLEVRLSRQEKLLRLGVNGQVLFWQDPTLFFQAQKMKILL